MSARRMFPPLPPTPEAGSGRPPEIPPPPGGALPPIHVPSATIPGAARRQVRGTRLAIVLAIAAGLVVGVIVLVVTVLRGAGGDELGAPPGTAAPTATPLPPSQRDTDGDGLNDEAEVIQGTDPAKGDTDGDGYTDLQEVNAGYDPLGPGRLDQDKDGLSDVDEARLGTDARNADTDGDGYFDGKEVQNCYDPRVASPNDKVAACPPYPGL